MNSAHATVATIAAVLFSCGNALAQLALMDWGLGKYRVDIDYYRVDVVEVSEAGPDKGVAVPYRPPIRNPAEFREKVPVSQDSMRVEVDIAPPL